jgi:hypothetical protein
MMVLLAHGWGGPIKGKNGNAQTKPPTAPKTRNLPLFLRTVVSWRELKRFAGLATL